MRQDHAATGVVKAGRTPRIERDILITECSYLIRITQDNGGDIPRKIRLVPSLAQDQSAIPRTDNPAVFDERLSYGGF
jgi:hypothetical protein